MVHVLVSELDQIVAGVWVLKLDIEKAFASGNARVVQLAEMLGCPDRSDT